MNSDLETIANLEYGKAVERISREAQDKLRKVQTMPRGGQMELAKLNVKIDQCEEICRAYGQIWLDLLESKNGGHLTREDVNFIVQKVQHVVDANKRNLMASPESLPRVVAGERIASRMDGVTTSIRRDLEIRIRKQEIIPKKAEIVMASTRPSNSAKDDYKFAQQAIEEARKSISEQDGKPHPLVGAVVVKNGKVLSTAHRGELSANHAEYIALEKKLSDEAVAGATVYTTLEPCTTRNHPKIPCASRLIERKVARVVVGMLDPDERITGKGWRKLRSAGIIVETFPSELVPEVEELNREFTRFCEQEKRVAPTLPASDLKVDTILKFKGKSVTVINRQKNGPHVLESYWPNDTVVADCTPLWVILEDRATKAQLSFPLNRVDVSFDTGKDRLRLEIER